MVIVAEVEDHSVLHFLDSDEVMPLRVGARQLPQLHVDRKHRKLIRVEATLAAERPNSPAAAAGETLNLEKPSCRRGQVQLLVRRRQLRIALIRILCERTGTIIRDTVLHLAPSAISLPMRVHNLAVFCSAYPNPIRAIFFSAPRINLTARLIALAALA